MLNEDDGESSVRAKIVSSLKTQYSILGPNDFDFVKVTQKRISVLDSEKTLNTIIVLLRNWPDKDFSIFG